MGDKFLDKLKQKMEKYEQEIDSLKKNIRTIKDQNREKELLLNAKIKDLSSKLRRKARRGALESSEIA